MAQVKLDDLKVPWATWMPSVNNGQGKGSYPDDVDTKSAKICLYLTDKTTPSPSDVLPPHLTLDVSAEGKAWQHVDLFHPAYGLNGGGYYPQGKPSSIVDANMDAGRTIQIAIIAPALYTDQYKDDCSSWWTDERLARLAWWLGYLTRIDISGAQAKKFVPVQMPYSFKAHASNSGLSRATWESYSVVGGVVGRMHNPYDTGHWGPGDLDKVKLIRHMEKWTTLAPPGSAAGAAAPSTLSDVLAEETTGGTNRDGGGEESDSIEDVSVAGKEFWFNPPLHNHALPARVDFASSDPTLSRYYGPETDPVPLGEAGVKHLGGLRLGRIIQDEISSGKAATGKYRWGFRFLYNPASIRVIASRNNQIHINPTSTIDTIVSGINQNFQVIAFQLLLNRQPELLGHPHLTYDYTPSITQEQKNGLQKYGTHYDLQALYRICNGDWNLEDRGYTSDLGFIIPAPARLMLGPGRNYYGFVQSINYTHTIFTKRMVPALTTVDITYRRHMDMTADALAHFTDLTGNTWMSEDEEKEEAAKIGNEFDAPLPENNKVSRDYLDDNNKHRGYDYTDVEYGNTVLACASGTVVHSGPATPNKGQSWGDWAGTHIVIDTSGIRHGYCHLSRVGPQSGASVAAGDVIGEIGKSGNVTDSGGGYVLHYEERVSPWKDLNDRKPVFPVREN